MQHPLGPDGYNLLSQSLLSLAELALTTEQWLCVFAISFSSLASCAVISLDKLLVNCSHCH